MTARRKICVVTGARSEYGLLYWLMKEIDADPALELQLIATAMHLSPEFGLTYRYIENDGFKIDAKVEMLLSSDTAVGVTKSTGLGMIGFADAFDRLKPDLIVVLGDRFESLAAAQAALIAKIPIAHIHGGEISEGAFDESIRHAISKMAHWHFVAAEPYRKRVIQMGETPERVFNFGAPGLDHLPKLNWLSREQLESALEVVITSPIFLITYHPVTLAEQPTVQPMVELLNALEAFPKATIIFTYPNADTGGRVLIEHINRFVEQNQARARAFASLGQQRYLSLMKLAEVVIGNSSSGLIEAPALKVPTVNIGDRQKGRLKAASVIDAEEKAESIERALKLALSEGFHRTLEDTVFLYGQGDASLKIKETLKTVKLIIRKPFFNLEHKY